MKMKIIIMVGCLLNTIEEDDEESSEDVRRKEKCNYLCVNFLSQTTQANSFC